MRSGVVYFLSAVRVLFYLCSGYFTLVFPELAVTIRFTILFPLITSFGVEGISSWTHGPPVLVNFGLLPVEPFSCPSSLLASYLTGLPRFPGPVILHTIIV